MKAKSLSLLFLISGTIAATAQSFSIDWFSVDGGGGTSTGGVYSLSGTSGQPDAGQMSGGNYTLTGGFWSIFAAIQTTGSPLLRVEKTKTNTVVVAWPFPSTGFSLEQNALPNTGGWATVTNSVSQVGSENQVIVSPPAGNRFFRLKSP